MFCASCGTPITQNLNYCKRCGARVEKLAIAEKSEALEYMSMATGFVGLGGLGLTVGLIAILLNFKVDPTAIVIITLAFLSTVFGISFLMLQRISQMSGNAQNVNPAPSEKSQLNAPNTAQLEEPRQPAASVTENTTRTLEKEPVK